MYTQRSRSHFGRRLFAALTVAILVSAAYANYQRPYARAALVDAPLNSHLTATPTITWPAGVRAAAIGTTDSGPLAATGSQTAVPIASITKVITALAILQQKPLQPGEQGPSITFTEADTALYGNYLARGGSVVPAPTGGQMTEYQALQAMLLPSANNIADSMAIWTFGSMDAYHAYARSMLTKDGLTQTTIGGDASGFSPLNVSTASDLVRLGRLALQQPVIAGIVSQRAATVAGVPVKNLNVLIGTDGIVGIKTGLTDEAGGCFLFAADYMVDGQKLTIIGAILGAATLNNALSDTAPLLYSARAAFDVKTPIHAGQVVGSYHRSDGSVTTAVAAADLRVVSWRGSTVTTSVALDDIRGDRPAGAGIGTITATVGTQKLTVPAVLKDAVDAPNWWQRVARY